MVAGLQKYAAMKTGIFAITRQGLIALTLSVGALWTCMGLEAVTRRHTNREIAASMRTLAELRRINGARSVSTPARSPIVDFRPQRPYSS